LDTIKTVKVKAKRPSKGVAKHNRLVKQEARRNSIPGTVIVKKKKIAFLVFTIFLQAAYRTVTPAI
jgi:hypothetical protein